MHGKYISHPKMSPGEIVRIIKSITGREVFRRKPLVKKELWGRVLDRWILRSNGGRKRELEDSRRIHTESGKT